MPYPPKNFEEVKVKGWKSGYLSVESVLRHLQRKAMGYGAPGYSSVEGLNQNRDCFALDYCEDINYSLYHIGYDVDDNSGQGIDRREAEEDHERETR